MTDDHVLPLSQVVTALRDDTPLPDRTVTATDTATAQTGPEANGG